MRADQGQREQGKGEPGLGGGQQGVCGCKTGEVKELMKCSVDSVHPLQAKQDFALVQVVTAAVGRSQLLKAGSHALGMVPCGSQNTTEA